LGSEEKPEALWGTYCVRASGFAVRVQSLIPSDGFQLWKGGGERSEEKCEDGNGGELHGEWGSELVLLEDCRACSSGPWGKGGTAGPY